MNILLLGSGGREHAIAWKISQSKLLTKLYIAPGNAGTEKHGININISPVDFPALGDFVVNNNIEMVVVGPEDPLVKGVSDYFLTNEKLKNIPVIGPSAKAALLEGSKDFAKDFMIRHNIPTARYKSVTAKNKEEGIAFMDTLKAPYVLKADGLAAGKGVLIINDKKEACEELENMLGGKFGAAGKTVVIEEFLSGTELSVFIAIGGSSWKLLPEAKDYKRIGEADTGPNTGGMGAVSPVPFANVDFMKKVKERIIVPTVNGLIKDDLEYKGFIFFGLINCEGDPYVIEYNARLGDPETEVILPRLHCDIIELFKGIANDRLEDVELSFENRTVTTVMLVSGGYPGSYEKGMLIQGLENVNNSIVFHAGSILKNDKIYTNGGRVIAVSSYGSNMQEALRKSYQSASRISFDGLYYRKDIGFDI